MQKEVFLRSEGDAYFKRAAKQGSSISEYDAILAEIPALSLPRGTKILEIGCGDGARLKWLADHCGFKCFGVDPSA